MQDSTLRFTCFPRTEPPPDFVREIVAAFRACEKKISTITLAKGLTSDQVLSTVRPGLVKLGFDVEASKSRSDIIERPVFYGENGVPTLRYQIDAYHAIWRCGLEVEAGRAWMGNAVYRDLVQALIMVQVDHLCLCVPNNYKFSSGGKAATSNDYDNAVSVADALYGHSRVRMPYGLTLIGY